MAFLDADVTTDDPAWFADLLWHFDDPRVGLVAPRVRGEIGSPIDLGDQPARIRAGTRVSYVPAAALVVRVDALDDIGGFDERLRFGEDVDLVWRLDEAGWRCRYEPAVIVRHRPRAGWRDWIGQRIGYGSSAAPLARRHPGALAPLRMSPWSLGAWLLAIVGRPALAGAVGGGSAVALIPKLPTVPGGAAFRLAALGNLRAGHQLARAIRRAWLPLVAIAALRSRAARRALFASLVAVDHPLEIVDDLAYCVGVWRSMWAERTAAPIVPDVRSWPGRPGRR